MKRYGVPYQGSKNAIAEQIVQVLPDAHNLYDLFAGGCAITHAAMAAGKYDRYIVNDINDVPLLFVRACNGEYANEQKWISREEFFAHKDSDPYVRILWSFGNNASEYLYSREIEPYKKAMHFAIMYGDFSLIEEWGLDLSFCKELCHDMQTRWKWVRSFVVDNKDYIKRKYIAWYVEKVFNVRKEQTRELMQDLKLKVEKNEEELRAYLCTALKESGKTQVEVDAFLGNQMSGHYFGRSQWAFPTREQYEKLQEILPLPVPYAEIYGLQELLQRLQSLESLQSLERLQRLQSLQSLQSLESLQSLQSLQRDYRDIEIAQDSVIYCDIPYKGTAGYNGGGFDHSAFYEWCKKQIQPLFISEYAMPEDDFLCVAEIAHVSRMNKSGAQQCTERVFVPRNQVEKGIVTLTNRDNERQAHELPFEW